MTTEASSSRGIGWVIGQMFLLGAVTLTAPRFRSPRPPALALAGGAALLGYATWMGLAGVRSLGRNLTPLPAPREDGELVTGGIFSRVRHPLYASVMALGFGWALLWGSRLAVWPATSLALYIHAKALHEERLLRARFPDYAGYAARVPRYLPNAG
jgi:protein-S-isoprenylcysteine O-methyltransferase Ste14